MYMKGESILMRQRYFKQLFDKVFSYKEALAVHVPKVTIVGDETCHIENHQGIVSFSDTELILKVKSGFVSIVGSSLVITMMLQQELFLKGHVQHVKFSNNLLGD